MIKYWQSIYSLKKNKVFTHLHSISLYRTLYEWNVCHKGKSAMCRRKRISERKCSEQGSGDSYYLICWFHTKGVFPLAHVPATGSPWALSTLCAVRPRGLRVCLSGTSLFSQSRRLLPLVCIKSDWHLFNSQLSEHLMANQYLFSVTVSCLWWI